MVIEIVAARILAPNVGVSLYTWTSIIGVVLAGISIGNYLGGRLADRFPSAVTLGFILLAGSVFSLSVLPLVNLVSGAVKVLPLIPRIVLLASALFFIPSLILGMVTPVVIKLRLRNLSQTGNVVGKIYAVSTAGAIFGTFITGFVLIQWIGTRAIILVVALVLLLMALAFGNLWRAKVPTIACLVLLLVIGGVIIPSRAMVAEGLYESNYYTISVHDDTREGHAVKVLILDNLVHSYVSLEDPTFLVANYQKIFAEIAAYVAQGNPGFRALFIGGGGYVMPQYLEEMYPQSTLEVSEIDPQVTRVAFEYLGLSPDTSIVTYNEDARMVVPKLPGSQYDLVIGDAFNDLSVPYHLTTREFNEQIRGLLKEKGIYAVNVVDKLHSGQFLRAYVNTLQQAFPYVYLICDGPEWEEDYRKPHVVLGSFQSLSAAALEDANGQVGQSGLTSHITPQDTLTSWLNTRKNILLTDDYAPVDNLVAPLQLEKRSLVGPQKYYDAATELFFQGKLKDAIAGYDEAIRLDPYFAQAYNNRGLVYARLGQFQRAIQDFNEAIQLDPRDTIAYYNRGTAYSNLGQFQQAIQDFDQAISLNPRDAESYYYRGLSYVNLNQFQRAIQDFDQAIQLNSQFAEAYYKRATTYQTLGQFQPAIQDLDQVIRLKPQYVEAYDNRGLAYVNQHQYQRAIQDFDQAIVLNPKYAGAYNNRGIAYASLGQYQRAIQDFDRAISLDPQYAKAYNNRGTAYINLNQFKRAIQDFDQAITLNPRYTMAYGSRGTAYFYLGQFERAIQDFDQAISLDPQRADGYAMRALAHTRLNMDIEAQQDFDQAVRLGYDPSLLQAEIEKAKEQR